MNLRMRVTRRESGFSLLEVMIAMVIIAFAIFAIMSMILGTMASQESLREMQTAKEAVAQKIEQVKSNTFQVAVATYPSGSSQLFPVPGLVDLNYFDKVARGTVTTQL
ncbi:MAG TPA: prepilin-type N-terminal cleavage/methylation domain-containing protein, partial [Planctomycetota bacterium]|nr:prepilin-type N-terminal cleavage/methylation domain-containing protein [Planctomycetota bacterium]